MRGHCKVICRYQKRDRERGSEAGDVGGVARPWQLRFPRPRSLPVPPTVVVIHASCSSWLFAYFFPKQRDVDLELIHELEQAQCWADKAPQSRSSCGEMSESEHALKLLFSPGTFIS
jgi:hypothetical protein